MMKGFSKACRRPARNRQVRIRRLCHHLGRLYDCGFFNTVRPGSGTGYCHRPQSLPRDRRYAQVQLANALRDTNRCRLVDADRSGIAGVDEGATPEHSIAATFYIVHRRSAVVPIILHPDLPKGRRKTLRPLLQNTGSWTSWWHRWTSPVLTGEEAVQRARLPLRRWREDSRLMKMGMNT